MKCLRPPAGWSCSRPAGHAGPCAARPDAWAEPKPFPWAWVVKWVALLGIALALLSLGYNTGGGVCVVLAVLILIG